MRTQILFLALSLSMLGGAVCSAAESTAASPGQQLPQPDPAFTGKIAESYQDSTPSFPPPVRAAKGSPNVLIILLDDVGFGMCSTFGGPVPTPHMDQLARNGLKYTRFHTTALCSPTRGALLAGAITIPSARG